MQDSTAAELIKNDQETLKYMRLIANANKPSRVVFRAILAGIFSALGTTLGFALLLFILAQSVSGLRQIPFVDQFLADTKLDLLIESQLANVSKEVVTTDPEEETDAVPTEEITELTYSDSELGFSFRYPSTLDSFREISEDGVSSKQIRFSGKGSLQAMDVYVNQDVVIFGSDSIQKFVAREDIDRITISVFENGATVSDLAINNPLFFTQFTAGDNKFNIVGIGDSERPKLSREVFVSIIESLEFSNL